MLSPGLPFVECSPVSDQSGTEAGINNHFHKALFSLPRPGGNGYHPRLLGVANVGIRAGLQPVDVAAAIRAHTPAGGRCVPDREIADAVHKAYRDQPAVRRPWAGPRRPSIRYRCQAPRPEPQRFDAAAFMAARLAEGRDIREADIWEASPVRIETPPGQDAQLLLESLYAPGDVLFIGDQYGRTVKTVAEWLTVFRAGQPIPPHIIPNPLTGAAATTKDGRPSFRADACVKSFRFAVAEFDGLSREDQLSFWWAVNLPLCALIDSGGKSLHAWVRIDGIQAAEQWTRLVEDQLYGRYLVPLDCDAACRNEARLSRMPGHFRAEKKRWQRILFLAPEGRRVNPWMP